MKILFILLIGTHVTYASFWQECEGIVTIVGLENVNKEWKADLLVHEHTFKCKGHSDSLYNVVSQNVHLQGTTDITPKKQRHYNIKYKYQDGRTIDGVAVSRSWELLSRKYFIPTKPKEASHVSKKSVPKVPSEGIDLHADIQVWEKANKGKK